MDKEWKPIKEFNGYFMNEKTAEILSQRILKPGTQKKSERKFVILAKNGEKHHKYVHLLYEETFNKPLGNIKTRPKKKYTWKGETKTLKEWSKILNLPYPTLYYRIHNYNHSIDKAFTTPVRSYCFK